MSTTSTRSDATDIYQVFTSYDETSKERLIVTSLARNVSDASYNSSYVDTNAATWTIEKLNANVVNTSAVSAYPAGYVTEKSVMTVDYDITDISYDSYVARVTDTSYVFSATNTSTPYYNCNYVFTPELRTTFYADSDNLYQMTFDSEDVNYTNQYSINSRFNTSLGQSDLSPNSVDPIKSLEDIEYNSTDALGGAYNKYADTINSNGSVHFTDISTGNKLTDQAMVVSERTDEDYLAIDDSELGIYRFTQSDPNVTTSYSVYNINTSDSVNLSEFPVYDYNDGDRTTLAEPSNVEQLYNLFSEGVATSIAPEWDFNMRIVPESGSGYSIDTSNLSYISQIDNDGLKNSYPYMENDYQNSVHSIDITSGSVSLSAGLNGVSDNLDFIQLDASDGEKLDQSMASQNGEIMLVINDTLSRTQNDFGNISNVNILNSISYFDDDDANYIPDAFTTNLNVNVAIQKVCEKSSNVSSSKYLKASNSAIMSFHDGESNVNASYNSSDITFTYDSSSSAPKFFKINLYKELAADAIFDSSSNPINEIKVYGTITNLIQVSDNQYRVYLRPKSLTDLATYSDFNNNGWQLTLSGSDTYLKADSDNEYNGSGSVANNIHYVDTNATTTYSVSYGTNTGISPLLTEDYVTITNNSDNSIYTINQDQMTRINISEPVIDDTLIDVSNVFGTDVRFDIFTYKLFRRNVSVTYNTQFPLRIGAFTNIICTTPTITMNSEFYIVKSIKNGKTIPHAMMIRALSSANVDTYSSIVETVSFDNEGDNMEFSGTGSYNDMLECFGKVQSYVSSDWQDISSEQHIEFFNGNAETFELNSGYGELTLSLEFNPYASESMAQEIVMDKSYYTIPFYLQDINDTQHSISVYEQAVNTNNYAPNLSDVMIGTDAELLQIDDAFSAINDGSWNVTSTYGVIVNQSDTTTTISLYSNVSTNIIATIELLNNVVYLGYILIEYNPSDIIRAVVSYDGFDSIAIESYFQTTYANDVLDIPAVSGVKLIGYDGYQIGPSSFGLGYYRKFHLLQDLMSYNLSGSASSPTYISAVDEWLQYTSGDLFSAMLKFNRYRGYYGTTGSSVQYYSIVRTGTSIEANIGDLSQALTSSAYNGQSCTLSDVTNETIHVDLGLQFSNVYSILPSNVSSPLSIPINVVADAFYIDISNPNQSVSVSAPAGASAVLVGSMSGDLKTYDINGEYTFSNLVNKIRPRRITLHGADWSYDDSYSAVYNIHFEGVTPLYVDKSNTWLGDPTLATYNMSVGTLATLSEIQNGIKIGKNLIRQDPENSYMGSRTMYYVVAPPTYQFKQMSTLTNHVPYNYDDYVSNILVRHQVIVEPSSRTDYNPFGNYSISSVSGSVSVSSSNVNDITFSLPAKSYYDLIMSESENEQSYLVKGVYMTVYMYTNAYDSDLNPHVVYDGYITDLSTSPDSALEVGLICRGRDASGGLLLSALQYPEDIGYATNEAGYLDVFNADSMTSQVLSDVYNIDFNIKSPTWNTASRPIYFNFSAEGARPVLYTVINHNDASGSSQSNYRRVYKYTSPTLITEIQGKPTYSVLFSQRYYKDYVVPDLESVALTSSASTVWNYQTLLSSVSTVGEITWTLDDTFSDTLYVGWAFGNQVSATKLPLEIFAVPTTDSNMSKFTFISLKPFMRFVNQFGLSVGSVAWDGTVVAPSVSSRVYSLAPQLTTPLMNSEITTAIEMFSDATLS
jgi:hypothetical protein